MSYISTLRRTSEWEPPTLVDSLLSSPLTMLATIVYQLLLSLRGRPFVPPATRAPIRLVCISDTHDLTLDAVPDGDVLIHAGDMSSRGTVADVQAQIDWLASLPHPHKVVVAGNHDECLLPGADRAGLDLRGVTYLENTSATLEFASGRRLNVFGTPYMDPWPRVRVPMDTEVLVTHHPPVRGRNKREGARCPTEC
jgi:predicted phosphodiesterase